LSLLCQRAAVVKSGAEIMDKRARFLTRMCCDFRRRAAAARDALKRKS
jgi:hypothetical protein